MISLWFASLTALVAQRTAVVGGVEREESTVVIAIAGCLLAVGAVCLLAGKAFA